MKRSIGAKTLIYPTPTWVVGTYDKEGKPNVATVAWGGICCSEPPCVAVALRKATYSYWNIVERKAFTVSVPSETHVKQADYFGIASDAPYVAEFPLTLECRLLHTLEIGLHTQFVGEILDVKAEESVLSEEGLPAIEKVKPFVFAPDNHTYHAIGQYLGKAFAIGKEV